MPKHFMKTQSCGCIVTATSVGCKKENNKVLYLIGGHTHIKICEKCTQNEIIYDDDDDDTTDGNDGWIEYIKN